MLYGLLAGLPEMRILARRRPRLVSAQDPGSGAVVPVQLQELDCLSSVRIYIPKDLRPPDARQMALKVTHSSCHAALRPFTHCMQMLRTCSWVALLISDCAKAC